MASRTSPATRRMPDLPLAGPVQAPGPVSFLPQRSLLCFSQQMLAARARCARYFPKTLFRDSAWDMMLELFIAGEQRQALCVKQLTHAVNESAAGAVRRIDRLEEAGLARRRLDPRDRRRMLIELTDRGREAMTAMLGQLFATIQTQRPRPFAPEASPGLRG